MSQAVQVEDQPAEAKQRKLTAKHVTSIVAIGDRALLMEIACIQPR